jgi:RNA polymerase sigma-70 factor, ECF subfamily
LDRDGVHAFVRDDYQRIVAGLAVVCGNRALAEDAVQEALARAAARARRGERLDDPRAWVAVVARNYTRSVFRRMAAERRARDRAGRHAEPNEESSEVDRIDLLAAVRALRPNQREAIALYYFADLSVEEVGRVMGLHREAVKGLLHRGRASLAQALGPPAKQGEVP